ncbi:MAG: multicopper oxidase domain-containing protein [Planctomycetota bacterium]
MLTSGAAALASSALVLNCRGAAQAAPGAKALQASGAGARHVDQSPATLPGEPGRDYTPVVTPNGATLPFRVVDGVKIYHLVAEAVEHEFAPGLKAHCWGYNGRVHGPTIEAVEGDRLRIYVTNRLPEPTSVHWHGILVPNGMDGVAGLNLFAIRRGDSFRYDSRLPARHAHVPPAP